MAVLLLHALSDLLESGRVRDHLIHADCPATHSPLRGAVNPGGGTRVREVTQAIGRTVGERSEGSWHAQKVRRAPWVQLGNIDGADRIR